MALKQDSVAYCIWQGGMYVRPFIFVADGIERALEQSQAAAGDKVVCVAGGAETARQFLQFGLLDEVQIHLVARLLGGGLRLFDHVPPVRLEQMRVLHSPGVTHLRYRVVNPNGGEQ